MDLKLFSYNYPKELIAQQPLTERDASKMMVLNRVPKKWAHHSIKELPDFLSKGDVLVFNNTKVFPARILAQGTNIELLLLEKLGENVWRCLGKPLKKVKEGLRLQFGDDFFGKILEKTAEDCTVEFEGENSEQQIEKWGLPPLPPYIQRKTKQDYTDIDRERYQSIFAKISGSAAAPTASFHFSQELLQKIIDCGVQTTSVTLHVSTDTFLPIRSSDITQHRMHGEKFWVPKETADIIHQAKKEGRRVIAVGTTVVRALESDWNKSLTDLFIYPEYPFKIVDGILTNFHQPESTLIVLVSAFANREFILQAYQEAITKQYRLFSYGDCMLIL